MRYSTRQGLRAGVMFGLFFGLWQCFLNGVTSGFVSGVFGGVMFGLVMGAILRRKERIWAQLREPYVAEGIVHEGPANCAIGPGYLVLTQKRLAWHPQLAKLAEKKILIAREALAKISKASGLGAQIRIEVKTGASVQFMVWKRDEWLKHLSDGVVPLPQARVV